MPEKDLKQFIQKVHTLNKMLSSLETIPGRKETLESCTNHDDVVKLAKSWGYDIGRRWGE